MDGWRDGQRDGLSEGWVDREREMEKWVYSLMK